jgi:hypothetical protein
MKETISHYKHSGHYQTPMADCFLYEDQILHVKVRIDGELTQDIVDAHNELSLQFTQGRKVAVLFDLRDISILKIPNSVMRYWAQPNQYTKEVICFSVLLQGRFLYQLVSFYIRIFRPILPTRLFEDEGNALDWIQEQIKAEKP